MPAPVNSNLCTHISTHMSTHISRHMSTHMSMHIFLAHRFLEEGTDGIKDLNDSDQSKFVAALALPSIKAFTVASNAGYK